MKKVISTTAAPLATNMYSQAIEANGTLYISGQIPVNPQDGTMPVTFAEQIERVLDNLAAILAEAGYTTEQVVKVTVLLDDMNNFGAMNEAYVRFFTGEMPARVCYQVVALPKGAQVEIDLIAVK